MGYRPKLLTLMVPCNMSYYSLNQFKIIESYVSIFKSFSFSFLSLWSCQEDSRSLHYAHSKSTIELAHLPKIAIEMKCLKSIIILVKKD